MTTVKTKKGRSSRMERLRRLGPHRPRLRVGFALPWTRAGTYRVVLPFPRNLVVIGISGALFAALCIPLLGMAQNFSLPADVDLFDIVFQLFTAFWLLGWSVGVVITGAVFLALLLGREVVVARPGVLTIRLEILGAGAGIDHDVTCMRNLRTEPAQEQGGSAWRGPHLGFDFYGIPIAFGSGVSGLRAEEILAGLRAALVTPVATGVLEPPPVPAEPAPAVPAAMVAPAPPPSAASLYLLVAANFAPVAGVLLAQWNVGQIMLLYWAESAVIGVFNLMKMWTIGRWSLLLQGPLFVGHYGAFMSVHLLFIFGMFVSGPVNADLSLRHVAGVFGELWPAMSALVVSHGVSYWLNFVGRREFEGRTLQDQVTAPYRRIILMHVTIIFGAFLVLALDTPLPALLLLIALKTAADVHAHRREHGVPGQESA